MLNEEFFNKCRQFVCQYWLLLWYLLWFILGMIYLYYYWWLAMDFIPFNGHSLIFILWLSIIFKPFIKTIDSKVGSIGFNELYKKNQKVEDDKELFKSTLTAESEHNQEEQTC